jgi:hypothetical protein
MDERNEGKGEDKIKAKIGIKDMLYKKREN